ncbi:MAG: 50S ribosomal protein L29 [candidate division WOR-3 bacterium]|uniref:Large ribosomal subunit protein uL29 n=1 Tax=candidate division WOR-3 bacterium TaxID=2052148 RepID=A0A7C4S0U9_UNCW3
MKPFELRELSDEELLRKYFELSDEYFKLRIRKVTETLPNPKRLTMLKRDIARVLTILRERGYTKEKVLMWGRKNART